jgi:hypothetical protein
MRFLCAIFCLISMSQTALPQEIEADGFGKDYFNPVFTSINGGLSLVTGHYSSYYSPGFTVGLDILYRPVKQFGIGISPFFSRWSADLSGYSNVSASDNNIGINGVFRGILVNSSRIYPYLQIGTGLNILISSVSGGGMSDSHTENYWGMVFTGGVIIHQIDIGITYGFLHDSKATYDFPFISFTLGYGVL